ncbi:MAG: helix-hairpin-helix domain-containing protein [Bacteroidales bacterium]|nr:helix-hairpin-helix domain-containing protein [Bacteroidales bacterium]
MKTNLKGKSSLRSPEPPSRNEASTRTSTSSATFKYGAICFAFLIVGYQVCLFVHRAAVLRIESLQDHPDTVYIVSAPGAPQSSLSSGPILPPASLPQTASAVQSEASSGRIPLPTSVPRTTATGSPSASSSVPDTVRVNSIHSDAVRQVRRAHRPVENFAFNPNTVSLEDLQRLGFSQRQAQSIVNYREKGGRFARAEDFGKSYVVSDSVFRRLRPFIRIPKLDINSADSAAFDDLPGIGPYYASQIVKYRTQLGGYASTEQLMDLYRFDEEKFAKIEDLIECKTPNYFDLWNVDEDALSSHPVIRKRSTARAILRYKENTSRDEWSIDDLYTVGVIDSLQRLRLIRCTSPAAF